MLTEFFFTIASKWYFNGVLMTNVEFENEYKVIYLIVFLLWEGNFYLGFVVVLIAILMVVIFRLWWWNFMAAINALLSCLEERKDISDEIGVLNEIDLSSLCYSIPQFFGINVAPIRCRIVTWSSEEERSLFSFKIVHGSFSFFFFFFLIFHLLLVFLFDFPSKKNF